MPTLHPRIVGFGMALVALAAPLSAAVVVDALRLPPGTASPLVVGDVVLRWRALDDPSQRGGELRHWGELDLLMLVEAPRGPLEVDLERDGVPRRATLPAAAWTLQGRPVGVEPDLLEFVGGFAGEQETAAAEVERRVAGQSEEVRGWVWARFAEARIRQGDAAAAQAAYSAAVAASAGPIAAELERAAGDALRRLGRLDEAEAAYRRALATWQRLGPEGLGASLALSALGSLSGARYELAEAQRWHSRALALRKRLAPGSWLHANALNNLGTIAGRRNDLAAADSLFLESLELAERRGGDPAAPLANLGAVARLRGDLERAEHYTRRAIELLGRAGNSREVAAKLTNLGNVLGDARRFDEAIAVYGEALELLASVGADHELRVTSLANRAHLLQLQGDFDAAELDLAAARALAGFDRPRTSTEALLASILVEQAEARGDLAAAASWAEVTLEARARIQPDSSLEALAASRLARIRDAQGRPGEAEPLFRRAIAALERQQERLGGGDRGLVAFRAKHGEIYRGYLEFLLRAGRPEAAFEVYERSRARALLALLGERDLDYAPAEVDPGVARRRRQLALELDRAYAALARLPVDVDAQRDEQRRTIEALHAERDRVTQQIHAASPRAAAAEAPAALGLAAIRAALPDGTLLLAYSLGPSRSTLFALDQEHGLDTYALEATEAAIAADIARWRDRLEAGPLARRERAAIESRLSQTLLGPVARRLDAVRGLFVVPDGALHALAFAALPDPRDERRRLLQALPIAYQVSGSVFAALQRRTAPRAIDRVAVFADPAAPDSAAARYRRDFGRLPAARREAQLLGEVFAERARLYVGELATEEAARREVGSATVSHFACHAAVDEALPLDSALLLSPSGGDEGLLQAWEIAEQVDVGADLVVLSACETARGAARAGEGILGLVRALQVAGARAVVASLWRVDDESAAELMGRFHAGLAAGLTRDEALRRAQLELLAGPIRTLRDGREVELDASDPRHWAPFVLIGPPD